MENNAFATRYSQKEIVAAQSARDPAICREIVHYQNNGVELSIDIYRPNSEKYPGMRPGVLFFFGGGFKVGTPLAFREQAEVCAREGYVAFSADYRISSLYDVNARDSICDGAAAWLYVRENAEQWNLDINKVVLAGGSAGGTIAAMCGPLTGIQPAGLVLFNPGVRDNDNPQTLMCKLTDREINGVPVLCIDSVQSDTPPILIQHGEEDKLISVDTVRRFAKNAAAHGVDVDLIIYPNVGHGFFNFNRSRGHFLLTLGRMLLFLERLFDAPQTKCAKNTTMVGKSEF